VRAGGPAGPHLRAGCAGMSLPGRHGAQPSRTRPQLPRADDAGGRACGSRPGGARVESAPAPEARARLSGPKEEMGQPTPVQKATIADCRRARSTWTLHWRLRRYRDVWRSVAGNPAALLRFAAADLAMTLSLNERITFRHEGFRLRLYNSNIT